jgi:pimeloyl-ACP methyl ester carboxylesterase
MASSLASTASLVPAGAALRARARAPRRAARAAPVRASGATYDEVFDGATGQMIQTLSQSTETVSAGGLEWSYRLGVPEEGVEAKPNKVVLVHGAGALAFTFSKLMRELQTRGYICVAPDMPGHGATSKPPPANFAYDLRAYQTALESFLDEMDLGTSEDSQIDLVVSGFFTSQAALLFAAAHPARVRRVCVLNAPLGNGHKLPDPLGVYGRPFGMGKGAGADVYKLNYFGNEFAIPPERMEEYEKPYGSSSADAAAARDAFEATATATSLKDAMQSVTTAFSKAGRGAQKVRVVWGSADKYLGDAPMYKWCEDVRASFDVMRKVGHMPQEDFAEETAKFVAAFFESEGRVGALGSVRLGKINKDDDYDRS